MERGEKMKKKKKKEKEIGELAVPNVDEQAFLKLIAHQFFDYKFF